MGLAQVRLGAKDPMPMSEPEAPATSKPAERPPREPKPPWLKVRAPGGERYAGLKETLRRLGLKSPVPIGMIRRCCRAVCCCWR